MTEKQPKALECAEDLAIFMRYLERIWGDDYDEFRTLTESEKELRRLHEVNVELMQAMRSIAAITTCADQDQDAMCAEIQGICRIALAALEPGERA